MVIPNVPLMSTLHIHSFGYYNPIKYYYFFKCFFFQRYFKIEVSFIENKTYKNLSTIL